MKWIGRRKALRLALAAVVAIGVGGWLVLRWIGREEDTIRRRVEGWGGNSQPLLNVESPLLPLRPVLGDRIFLALAGSRGRLVSGRPDATREQLADLLAIQPICLADAGGGPRFDDGWVAGIRTPGAMIGLRLDGTAITDRSVATIEKMVNLSDLGLVGTALSDSAIDRLLKLPKLNTLIVGGPNIRAIWLLDPRVLNDEGRPASVAGGPSFVRGRIAVAGLPGKPGAVRVMVRAEDDPPPWYCVPYGWNATRSGIGTLVEEAPGTWLFDVRVDGIHAGKSSVEVWVDVTPTGRPGLIRYRLEPFAIEMETGPSPAGRRRGAGSVPVE